MVLFRKELEPRCAYCRHSSPLDDRNVGCYYKGVVGGGYHCRRFRYDPLKRVPPLAAPLRRAYSPDDFKL